ncbi:hypothetical protein ACFFKC_17615 [Pseudoduganella danionis]|uniref:Uncharacterized protein n=1 Tax=Pseudoduganella danionis TaxID=1890295 RepID=A0ABW9SND2_9BURK|nr:hypothetical protein [Pseudoduganella danionis]MTW33707.1 hypothetical protein [Pseudoduganella danionis]
MQKLQEAEKRAGSLAIFGKITKLREEERDDLLNQKGGALQYLGTMRAMAGDADGAAQVFSWWRQLKQPEVVNPEARTALEKAIPEDAIRAIVRAARTRQIVILNEAHHIPEQRVFAMQLAHELKKIGFEYLACETFDEKIPVPMPDGHVSTSTGFYSKEPMFAAFLRSAHQDGWKLVGYDNMIGSEAAETAEERQRLRELGAATNLFQRVFEKNIKARVFIYVGYSHASKTPAFQSPTTFAWLAAHLKHQLNTDPLTVDQSAMFSYGNPKAEHPLYRTAIEQQNVNSAFVLKAPNGNYEVLSDYRGRMDMQVFHPDHSKISATGRPEWMQIVAKLKPRHVPADLLPSSGRRLIQAYFADEGTDSVPVDMVMVEAGKPAPMLMLPKGNFRFRFEE